jgi:hypothetical protein
MRLVLSIKVNALLKEAVPFEEIKRFLNTPSGRTKHQRDRLNWLTSSLLVRSVPRLGETYLYVRATPGYTPHPKIPDSDAARRDIGGP